MMQIPNLKLQTSKVLSLESGFTFIELIIVFTVTAILGTIGIASLAGYATNQQVASTTLDLKTLFQLAQSRSSSQVKPSQCLTDLSNPNNNSTLLGYEVDFCNGAQLGMPSACRATDDYEVNALCGNGIGYTNVASKKYSSTVTITTTSRSYFFPVLSGGVDHSGTVQVSEKGRTQSIGISSAGVIQ